MENSFSSVDIEPLPYGLLNNAAPRNVVLPRSACLALFMGLVLYSSPLNELEKGKKKTETEQINGAVSTEAVKLAFSDEGRDTISERSADMNNLWNVDPHLEHLVDERIIAWQMSSSPETGKGPLGNISNWLSNLSVYRGYIAEASHKYGIDVNFLSALLVWESGGNPKAKSNKRARGVGQFLRGTASEKGLIVNDVIDERLDPAKSIDAAASYIRDAAEMNKGYSFLITAHYNYGPGNVRKITKRFGLNESLFFKLPKETKKHYINIFAIKKLLDNPEEYRFSFTVRPSFKSIVENSRFYLIKKGEDLTRIAEENNVDMKTILFKNPMILNPSGVQSGTLIKI